MNPTTIHWPGLTHTINPIVGCPGCDIKDICYAKKLHDQRYTAYKEGKAVPECYSEPFETIRFFEKRLDALKTKAPKSIFVGSMGDMFHPKVNQEHIAIVLSACNCFPQHQYWFLTKHPKTYFDCTMYMVDGAYYGTTITKKADIQRYNDLVVSIEKAKGIFPDELNNVKTFVSLEPFLEDMGDLDLSRVDLVIIGPDTTKGAKFDPKWIENIKAKKIHYKNPEKWMK